MSYKKIATTLLLAVVLFSSLAWTPAPANVAAAAPAAPRISAQFIGRDLIVTGSGLGNRQWYDVRARTGTTNGWYLLGDARSNRKGKIEEGFRLPLELRNAALIRVCAEKQSNGAEICVYAYRRNLR